MLPGGRQVAMARIQMCVCMQQRFQLSLLAHCAYFAQEPVFNARMVDAEQPQLCIVRMQASTFGGRVIAAESGTSLSCLLLAFLVARSCFQTFIRVLLKLKPIAMSQSFCPWCPVPFCQSAICETDIGKHSAAEAH